MTELDSISTACLKDSLAEIGSSSLLKHFPLRINTSTHLFTPSATVNEFKAGFNDSILSL
jgi:hypothetical protein